MMRALEEFVEVVEECIDEFGHAAVADAILAPVEGHQDRANRDAIHVLAIGDQRRVILVTEVRRVVAVLEVLRIRDRQQLEVVRGGEICHRHARLGGHDDGGRDLAGFQLFDGFRIAEMELLDVDAERLEQQAGR